MAGHRKRFIAVVHKVFLDLKRGAFFSEDDSGTSAHPASLVEPAPTARANFPA